MRYARADLLAGGLAVLSFLLFSPVPVAAQPGCDTGCDSGRSCKGSGGWDCSAGCVWDEDIQRYVCICIHQACPPEWASISPDLDSPYEGPGYLVAAANGYLISDCRHNSYGVVFSNSGLEEVTDALSSIRLLPPRQAPRIVGR